MSIRLENIYFSYNKKDIVIDNITLEFNSGIYGLLGPNGAGKSTLIKILTMSVEPDSGYFHYGDKYKNKNSYKNDLGYMPQSIVGFSKFKVIQFLYYIASLKGLTKEAATRQIDILISDLSLEQFTRKSMDSLSGGMRQRVLFAQAIIGNPRILILDEPTAGLDPFERIRLRNIISKYSKNKIVIIATHVMQDVEAIAQNLLFMKHGKILFNDSVEECLSSFNVSEVEIMHEQLEDFQKHNRISRLYQLEDGYRVRYISEHPQLKPDLDDAYLYYLVDAYDE